MNQTNLMEFEKEGSSIGFSKTVQYVQTSSGINSLNADLVYSVGLARGYTEAVCLKTASDVGLDTQDLNDLLNT